MASHEGLPAGQVGSVEPLGDDFGFKVWARDSAGVGLFVFHTERDARRAARFMEEIVADATAVFGCEELLG